MSVLLGGMWSRARRTPRVTATTTGSAAKPVGLPAEPVEGPSTAEVHERRLCQVEDQQPMYVVQRPRCLTLERARRRKVDLSGHRDTPIEHDFFDPGQAARIERKIGRASCRERV